MAEDSASADRTEEPTARRLQKAREEGDVARSIEVPAAGVLLAATAYLFLGGGSTAAQLKTLFASGFVFDQGIVRAGDILPAILAEHLLQGFLVILPLLALTLVAAIAASGLTGGYLFSIKSAAPNFAKLNVLSGVKRIFGLRAIVELTKAVLKLLVVTAAVAWVVNDNLAALMQLGGMSIEPALAAAAELISRSAIAISLSFVLIALIDAFYQRNEFTKRMRMTKQEIRDEMKDAEGRPEVRAQIRRRQREMATSRMMERIKDADVIITNPEHFAVALAYDPSKDGAPILLAKGVDSLAFRIISEAKNAGVHTFPAPPLARALYFTTKLNQPIHEDLYFAVAQVIAYVFSLNSFQPGMGNAPRPAVEVPRNLRFDREGKISTEETNL